MIRVACVCLMLVVAAPLLLGQCTADSPKLDDESARLIFERQAKTVFPIANRAPRPNELLEDTLSSAVDTTVPFLASWAATSPHSSLTARLADLELSRWDKEASGGSGAAGSTSVASSRTVASLFSFAGGNGAL